jgi:hypothetical protein
LFDSTSDNEEDFLFGEDDALEHFVTTAPPSPASSIQALHNNMDSHPGGTADVLTLLFDSSFDSASEKKEDFPFGEEGDALAHFVTTASPLSGSPVPSPTNSLSSNSWGHERDALGLISASPSYVAPPMDKPFCSMELHHWDNSDGEEDILAMSPTKGSTPTRSSASSFNSGTDSDYNLSVEEQVPEPMLPLSQTPLSSTKHSSSKKERFVGMHR